MQDPKALIPKPLRGLCRPVNSIKPYDANPRWIPEGAVATVAASIQAYGFWQPIVVDNDETSVIVAGHTRYAAAQMLGLKEVPVVSMEGHPREKARMYRLTDNKTNELTGWDFDGLKVELSDLHEEKLIPIGFENEMAAFASFDQDFEENEGNGDEFEEPPEICEACGQRIP